MTWSSSESTSTSVFDPAAKAVSDRQFNSAYGAAINAGNVTSNALGRARSTAMGMYDQAAGMLTGMGDAQRARITRDATAARNSVGNRVGTGLYNSTVTENMRQGVDRNKYEALNAVDESVRQQQYELMLQRIASSMNIDLQQADAMMQSLLSGAQIRGQQASTLPTRSSSTSTSSTSPFAPGSDGYKRATGLLPQLAIGMPSGPGTPSPWIKR